MKPHPALYVAFLIASVAMSLFLDIGMAVAFSMLLGVAMTIGWGVFAKPQSRISKILKQVFIACWSITAGLFVFSAIHSSDRDDLQWPSAMATCLSGLVSLTVSIIYWDSMDPRR